jgi:hypothetical protein
VTCQTEEYFEDRRKLVCTSGAPLHLVGATFQFAQDPAIWTDPPASVVQRIMEEMKRSTPASGGPDQMVCLGSAGCYLISPPPNAVAPLTGDLLPATISALVSMISPSISGGSITGESITSPVISGGSINGSSIAIGSGSVTVNVDSSNYVKVTDTAGSRSTQMQAAFFRPQHLANALRYAQIQIGQVKVSGISGGSSAWIAEDSTLQLWGAAGVAGVYINGTKVL